MIKSTLKEKFDKATILLKDKKNPDEVTTLIHKTSWVRILLEHDIQGGDSFFIEVEMSLPENVESKECDSSVLIDRLSEHLLYLQRLRDEGFDLSVIGTGCIYCASKEIQEPPEDNLFRALIPPETE
ncbi:MAG: hypothetical protein ACFFE2_00855 [Candidatus Thorarchaeota archaeon]